MKKYFLPAMLFFCICDVQSQNLFTAVVKDKESQAPLPGATVKWKEGNRNFVTDSSGTIVIKNIPGGRQTFIISHIGKTTDTLNYSFPAPADTIVEILLAPEENEEEEVVVTATRTSRTISNTPTRVEVITGEELGEKANMKPGDIRMLLSESTGIQTQQTSATSYNSSIRIQGLDGRFTQLLKDGYPLYGGFSGGLSIMQIVPLDLKQVEVIKGSSSTLYGGGAIAGLVNLVSKVPVKKREITFLINGTSANGLDLSGFYSEKFKKFGISVFSSRNSASAYDPAGIGLTAIPEYERYTINPKLFLYGEKTTANAGFSYITEDRLGGSIDYIKNGGNGYFEQNNTDRLTSQLGVEHRISDQSTINFKNSFTRFQRSIKIPSYQFSGNQRSTFSEISYDHSNKSTEWIAGANILTDDFREDQGSNDTPRNYHYNTFGLFVQNTWSVNNFLTIESGLRGDYVKQYGFELLPRISMMYRFTPQVTARLGGGFGYKTPTIFNEESERYHMQNIEPINTEMTRNERSLGVNFDVDHKRQIGNMGLAINQLLFYTRLNNPLILQMTGTDGLQFINANGHIDTRGLETNIKITYSVFKLFVGYTLADVYTHFNGVRSLLPLTAKHRLNNVLMYEREGQWKVGLEAYYVSRQKLNDGSAGKSYWTTGLMAEKTWKIISIFLNFENFTDTRQTKFDTIYTGSITNPTFRDIYAPVDGFVLNGGLKVRI